MTKKTRIGILGLGGVGGYIGGHLADKYFRSDKIEIIFITRPATERVVKKNGLKLITPQTEKIVFPALVTSTPDIVCELDFLICAVKSYDLEDSLVPLKSCITGNTAILTIQSGVDTKERILKIYPGIEILTGCFYIFSKLIEPGVVKETGNIHTLYFGSNSVTKDKLKALEKIFLDANIECFLSENIDETLWEKFLFVSSMATLTSFLNLTIGKILIDHKNTLTDMLSEIKSIADAKSIKLSDNIIEKTIDKMEKLPFEATTSMHRDFQKGGKTEFISLTEYVSKEGRIQNIPTPVFDKIFDEFINRDKGMRITRG